MTNFSEEIILQNASNASSMILQDGADFRRNAATVFRMMLVGVLGISLNTISIVFLYFNPSIKISLKITLMGMTLNDLCYTINSIVQGQPQWRWVSESPHCWPTVFFVVSPTLLSYFITINLAMHNFVAVVYPFHCDRIMSKRRSFWSMVACWVTGYLLVLAFLGTSFPKGFMCLTMNVMPRSGMAVVASFCVVSCGVIVGLNVVIGIKVRDSVKILKKDKAFNRKDMRNKPGKANKITEFSENSQSRYVPTKDISNNVINGSCEIVRVDADCRTSTWTQDLGETFVGKENISVCDFEYPSNFKDAVSKIQIADPSSKVPQNLSKMVSTDDKRPSNQTIVRKSQINQSASTQKPITSSTARNNKAHQSTASNQHGKLRRVKTSVTLMMLTIWSCSISLPLVVVIIYVAILAPDRQLFLNTEAGYALSLTGSIHSVGNPLLYGLRFINWRVVCQRLRPYFSLRL